MESIQDPSNFKQPVPADESQFDLYTIPSKSSWFSWDDIHETEKTHLKEFFDFSSITRTPKIYKEYRDFIISKYREDPSRRLTFTEVRKSLVGDISLLHKVFLFLESWGLINFGLSPETGEGCGSGEEEESQGKWKVRVEEGAPNGVRVVAVPNSLKPVTVPPIELVTGGEGVEYGFKLPPLASYRDVYSEKEFVLCGKCKDRCESSYYECSKDASFIICFKCYKNGDYGENRSLNDFNFILSSEEDSAVWSEGETLLLLESVLKHGNDWNLVVENVKTKSKADCISKLLQMPLGDLMLGSSHGGGRLLEMDENATEAIQGQVASSEFQSDTKIKTGNESHDVQSEQTHSGNNDNQVPAKRRKVTASPSHVASSLMKQAAAISSMVDPVIAASAADAAVTALCDEYQCTRDILVGDDNQDEELGPSPENGKDDRTFPVDGSQTGEEPLVLEPSEASSKGNNDIPITFRLRAATSTALGAAAARAKLLADQEEREMEYLMATIIDKQFEKLEYKMKHFDDLELIMEKEHAQLEHVKETMIQERLDVLRRVFDSGISRWKNLAPAKSQVDNVV